MNKVYGILKSMIQNELIDWQYELVEKLVKDGFFETDKYDLKEDIPHKSDSEGKDRIEKSICAFANTEGGFLIFGIKDNRKLQYQERIIGIDPSRDFPREIGDKTINIEPHIFYDFKNPAIKIPNSKHVIHVVKIPKSSERPHMTSKREFYYRTNRGNAPMSYQQIKETFAMEEQLRQKLRLLFIELLSNKEQAEAMPIPDENIEITYSLVTFDSQILQTLLVDTYPIILREKELVKTLMTIREQIKIINNKIKIFYSQITLPRTDMGRLVRGHNDFINKKAQVLVVLLDSALKILEERYGLSNPLK